jgi:hypothetical protein
MSFAAIGAAAVSDLLAALGVPPLRPQWATSVECMTVRGVPPSGLPDLRDGRQLISPNGNMTP